MDEDIQRERADMSVVVDKGSLEPGEHARYLGELNTKLPVLSRGKVDGNTLMVFTLLREVQ